MALILLDADGVVCGCGDEPGPLPLLGPVKVGDPLASRLHGRATAGDVDAAALHRAWVDLVAGRLTQFEHRHGDWVWRLQAFKPGSVAQAALSLEREPPAADQRRHRERLEDLLVNRTVQLAAARERAEAALRLRATLLAQASHEVRTPLNAIVSLSHLLAQSMADGEHRHRVRTIARSARRLSQLFDHVLTQVDGGADTLLPAPGGSGLALPGPEAGESAPAGRDAGDPALQLQARHAGRRVLLAEDDEVNQMAMLELLRAVGLEVDTADDGHEAVDRASGRRHALILLDLRMPRLDGLTAARTLRTLPGLQATPIVAITANATDADRRNCLEAGMNDLVPKPVDVQRLYAVLLHWLDQRPASTPAAPAGHPPAGRPAAAGAGDGATVQPLLGIEGLDALRGLAAVGGKPAVYRRLLQVFIDTHAGDGGLLGQQLQRQQTAEARALAHRLRGSAATLGLVEVEAAAGTLESAIDDGAAAAALPPLAQALVDALDEVLRSLRRALAI